MPATSHRQRAIRELEQSVYWITVLKRMQLPLWILLCQQGKLPFPITAFLNEELLLFTLLSDVLSSRYLETRSERLNRGTFMRTTLFNVNDDQFRRHLRTSYEGFSLMCDIIKHSSIFTNKSTRTQAPVHEQLAVALVKMGHSGNGIAYRNLCDKWGCSEGFVFAATTRVIDALCEQHRKYIVWPDEAARREESESNDERGGFLGAVGKVDGTDIPLAFKPGRHFKAEVFFNRKEDYALDLCGICNSDNYFTYITVGYPSSVHDARVFASTTIFKDPKLFFSRGEYLIGDAAYACTERMIPPFKGLASSSNSSNSKFNRMHACVRSDIEHSFGILKEGWASLKQLRTSILDKKHFRFAIRWIVACVILHNILISGGDPWVIEQDAAYSHAEEASSYNEQSQRNNIEGVRLRESIEARVIAHITSRGRLRA